jgi:hypothetical protein
MNCGSASPILETKNVLANAVGNLDLIRLINNRNLGVALVCLI